MGDGSDLDDDLLWIGLTDLYPVVLLNWLIVDAIVVLMGELMMDVIVESLGNGESGK